MTFGDDHASQFSRVAHTALRHLSATTGLPTCVLIRTEGGSSHALVAHDVTGIVRAPQVVSADLGLTAPCRVAATVTLPDDRPFGHIVCFGSIPAISTVEAQRHADVVADVLGALAGSELALANHRRVTEQEHAMADPLTGLSTRHAWEKRLRRDERYCAEFGESAAVIVVELDELKQNNERHGHSAGDEQLRLAGTLLRDAVGSRHHAARVTGDRLGILMIGIGAHEAGELERTVRQAFSAAQISAAVGVGHRQPEHGLEQALRDAESELVRTHSARVARLADANEAAAMLGAIERGEIVAYFQPVVDLRSGEVLAVEALARWCTPEGVREPDRFLRPLQQAGLLGALFDRILDDGLARLAQFRAVSPQLKLAVNIEFDTKADSSLLQSVKDRLQRHGLPASALSIELSERQTFDLPQSVRADLQAVADLGVQLMLDDFGTGFASLETLTTLPISGVKLDRRFTSQVVSGDREPVVVKAMIAMAAEAGLSVIAEGIETQLQCDRLVRMGCRLGQGYLFALPQPADAVAAVLSAPLVSLF